jgi:hypothetical protein
MASVELSPRELKLVRDGLVLLRDRHYRYYYDSTNPDGDTAQGHKAKAEELDQLRYRVMGGSW